jgi:putative inorganic carbon (hco3(-)) transporter
VVAAPGIGRLAFPATVAALAGIVGILAGIDPALAIAAAVTVAFVLLVLADLYVGLVLFTLLSFVAQIPGLGDSSVTFAKFAGLLLAISWLAVLATREDARADFLTAHPAVSFALVLFLGWAALSQLWAEDPGVTLDGAYRLALNAVLFLIIFSAVRKPGQAIGVIAAFVAGATIAAVYGLLFVAPEGTDDAARLSGTLDNPNELATVLVAAIALGIGLAAALRESPLARLGALVAVALCTAGVFLTGSRGGLVALAVALISFLVIGARFRGRVLVLTLAIIAAGVGYYSYIASPEARDRITDIESGTGRTDLWEIGWRMVEAEPVHGVGVGNFPVSSPQFLLEPGSIARPDFFISDEPKAAHNMYLEIWAELGTVGLALFAFVVGFGLYAAAKATSAFARRGDVRMEIVARAVFVALAAVLAADFFGSRQYNRELWILLGLAVAIWGIARGREPATSG